MIRDIITKSILLFTVFALVMSSTSCSGDNTNGEYGTNPSGSDGSGNITTDPENNYYSSTVYELETDGYILSKILDSEDRKIAVFSRFDDGSGANEYRLCIHDDNSSEWNRYVDLDSRGQILGDFCAISNNRIAATTYYGFDIYDLESGKLLQSNSDLYVILDESMPMITRRDDGMVIVKNDCIYLIDKDGNPVSQVPYTENVDLPVDNAYFKNNGQDYLALDNCPMMNYYKIDFDAGTLTYLCNSKELGLEFSAVYMTGGYAIDLNSGTVYQLDPSGKSKRACSYVKNMLIKPSVYQSGFDPVWYIFGENDYAVLYQHEGNYNEVVIIYPDNSLNLGRRTKLTVRGYDALSNPAMNYAAYKYNTSQSDFLLVIENYSLADYGYENATEAQASKLKLIQEFSKGNAPDIFFGNNFDYDQMGESGLVMDLAPYLNSNNISKDTISENAYGLFYNEDSCYKLFPGYLMFGLWSSDSFTGLNNNMSISDFSNFDYSRRLFGDTYASEIADFAIRYPIHNLVENGRFVSEDELAKIIQFAIDNGVAPDAEIKLVSDMRSVVNKDTSVCLQYIGSLMSYASYQIQLKDKIRFVGFPTVNGSVHVAYPYGLVAVSSGTKHPEECMKFISFLFSDDVQKVITANNSIPVSKTVFEDICSKAQNDITVSDDKYYRILFGKDFVPLTADEVESYREAVRLTDTLMINDWGLYDIITEEINSYYLQNKSVKDIAHSLKSRIDLYLKENGIE